MTTPAQNETATQARQNAAARPVRIRLATQDIESPDGSHAQFDDFAAATALAASIAVRCVRLQFPAPSPLSRRTLAHARVLAIIRTIDMGTKAIA